MANATDDKPEQAVTGTTLPVTPVGHRYVWPWFVLVAILVVGAGCYYFRADLLRWKDERFGTAMSDGTGVQATTSPSGGSTSAGVRTGGRGGRGGAGGFGGPVPVISVTAHTGNLPVYLTGLGTVTPLNTVTIHPRVDGEIDEVNYTEGQEVKEGDVLIQIDPRPFEVQLQQAQGQRQKDQAALDNAQIDFKRYKEAGTSVTNQELDTAASTVRQLQASLVSDDAAINSVKLQLTYAKVTAPVSGRIGLRLVDKGNIVHAADAQGLAVITQVRPISVIFSIPENDLPGLLDATSPEASNGLKVDAFDRDFKRPLAMGTLLALDNQIDQTTGTLKLKANFTNDDGRLFPNQFVNVRLLVRTLKNVVLVPAAAIQRGPDGTFVYIIDAESKVRVRKVTIGQTTNDIVQINEGLAAGDKVVTDGVDNLTEGAVVVSHGPSTRPGSTSMPSTQPGTHGRKRGNAENTADSGAVGGGAQP